MIKRSDFNVINKKLNDKDDVTYLKTQYPDIPYSTLIAIFSQKRIKIYRQNCYKKTPNIRQYYYSYLNNGVSFLELSSHLGLSSSIFSKQILTYIIEHDQNSLFNPENLATKETTEMWKLLKEINDPQNIIKKIFKNPSLVENLNLRKNIYQSIYNDDNCSPLINHIRSSTGSEYEYLLQEKLYKLNIPYLTENQLRKDGYPKTPDIKLEIPFAYKGFMVNWIESKASFCDDNNYKNTKDQIIGYKNRYGPGLAIYWFGYIDDLNNLQDEGVYITDSFPDIKDIEVLHCLDKNIDNNSIQCNNINQLI
ncbi:hypothetical protein DICPUDRAFT_27234 [Dictyostelium purpureum]|uniref:CDAN1-interacting nuclease 1 n=1 Tax=Dictyostelium purpureum TaxID=5786 RepID=F0Z9U0_DICPU|nr:uncharacterized protein DICPUDRAFT_27234 [Dictyostelium purpureum]EGC39271.1 hypothetical protein DICPUDRAFT_27234 [Dictyostelium purpureum]|eukprot:XP_003284175.1 hypothetical protein DICPUDRAFT_27234 [Dictyostelium purpureum]